MRLSLATLAITVVALSPCLPTPVACADPIAVTDGPGVAAAAGVTGAAGCGCSDGRQPAWHGNVRGSACGPVCQSGCGGVFHANPCPQLHLRAYARAHCMTLPPCFPRLHGWLAEGFMPSPPPPALPRCRQCGAVIEGGL